VNKNEGRLGDCVPEQTTGLRSDEVNTIGVGPLVDFELFAEGNAREDDNLRDLRHSRVTVTLERGEHAWKPFIKSGEISCPGALGRSRTGT